MNIYNSASNKWSKGADIPIPVDDSVSVLLSERYIYLVSGWSETKNVPNVQLYDTELNRWGQATPIVGDPLFGHFGTTDDNRIFYFDGVTDKDRQFKISNAGWVGTIDAEDITRIAWSPLETHPGRPRYRSAAGFHRQSGRILISGGTDNPYNYDGIGYDGVPSNPVQSLLTFDFNSKDWMEYPMDSLMDHRGLVAANGSHFTVGGMSTGQTVSARVHEV